MTNKTAVICDLAETYGILNWRGVPVRLLGTLVAGLGENTRTGKELLGHKGSTEEILLAQIFDALNLLMWSFTEDGQKGRHRPKPISDMLLGKEEQKDVAGYRTPEEYEKARAEIIEKIKGAKDNG